MEPVDSAQPASRPAPAATPAPVVPFWRLFAVHALLDDEARPLGEHRAPPNLPGAAPTQLKRCLYAGSRYDHALPMNVSALRQASQHWDKIVAGIGFLRYGFHAGAPALSLAELWRLLAAVAVLPSYLSHRAGATGSPWVPEAFVAAMYKASLGIKYMLESQLLREILENGSVHRDANVEELSALSESGGALIGVEQVCAAPANMIADTLCAFIRRGDTRAAAQSPLAATVGSWAPYRAFVAAACDLHAVLLTFSTLAARVQLALQSTLPDTRGHGAAAPTPESSPLEISMSITLGMRRLRWPLARLHAVRCRKALRGFDAVTADAGGGGAAAILAALERMEAVRQRGIAARQLERMLLHQTDAVGIRLREVCNLLAFYGDLERSVDAHARRIERRLNDALGRAGGDNATACAIARYCAVSPWTLAATPLGVPLAHEPASATIRCGAGHVAMHPARDSMREA